MDRDMYRTLMDFTYREYNDLMHETITHPSDQLIGMLSYFIDDLDLMFRQIKNIKI